MSVWIKDKRGSGSVPPDLVNRVTNLENNTLNKTSNDQTAVSLKVNKKPAQALDVLRKQDLALSNIKSESSVTIAGATFTNNFMQQNGDGIYKLEVRFARNSKNQVGSVYLRKHGSTQSLSGLLIFPESDTSFTPLNISILFNGTNGFTLKTSHQLEYCSVYIRKEL